MVDRRKALQTVREKLSSYREKGDLEKAIEIAKNYHFENNCNHLYGYVTINNMKGNILFQEVYSVSVTGDIAYCGVTAYDRKHKLYVKKDADGTIKRWQEARNKAILEVQKPYYHQLYHYRDKDEDVQISQFLFGTPEHTKPVEDFVSELKRTNKECLKQKKIDKYKALNKKIRKPPKDFFRYMQHHSLYREERAILYIDNECFCMTCGARFRLEPAPKHRKMCLCTKCGTEAEAISRKKYKQPKYEYRNALIIEKVSEDFIVLRVFAIDRTLISSTVDPQFEFTEIERIFVSEKEIQVFSVKNGDLSPRGLFFGNHSVFQHLLGNDWGPNADGDIYRKGLSEIMCHPVLRHIDFDEFLKEYKGPVKPQDAVRYILTHVSYPAMEWVKKSGFKSLYRDITEYEADIKAVFPHRKARNIYTAFGIDKQLYKRLYQKREIVTQKYLEIAREYPKATPEEWDVLKGMHDRKPLEYILRFTTLRKALKYIDAMKAKYEMNTQPVLTLWKDYLVYLEADENVEKNNSNVFPKNLKERHDQYQQIKDVAECGDITMEDLQSFPYGNRISKSHFLRLDAFRRLDAILPAVEKKYGYKDEDLNMQVLAPKYSIDIVDEGEKQSICVGNPYQKYIEKMADKETNILFLRNLDAPEKPYYTLEIREGKVIQVKGKCNAAPTNEVKEFMAKYSEKKQLEYNAAVY